MKLLKPIREYIETLDTATLSEERKTILRPLIAYINSKIREAQPIRLNFICTHNSRRSILAQVWAQTMATYFKMPNVTCFSGGTEVTAVFPTVAETLQNTGFKIDKLSEVHNPIYNIKFAKNEHPIIGVSKKWDDVFNPKSGFAAIMTCSQADENCPFIAGAEKRIPITFEDPKKYDNTPQQTEKYNESSLQIATELFYVFSKIEMK